MPSLRLEASLGARVGITKPRLSPLVEDETRRLTQIETWLLKAVQDDPTLLADAGQHIGEPGPRVAAYRQAPFRHMDGEDRTRLRQKISDLRLLLSGP